MAFRFPGFLVLSSCHPSSVTNDDTCWCLKLPHLVSRFLKTLPLFAACAISGPSGQGSNIDTIILYHLLPFTNMHPNYAEGDFIFVNVSAYLREENREAPGTTSFGRDISTSSLTSTDEKFLVAC